VGSVRDRVRHAFAVDPPGPAKPTPDQQPAVDWVCEQVARRHLTMPGLVALEMSRPLNFVFSQAMHFFSPGAWALLRQRNYEQYEHFAAFMEHRGAMEYLERRIEHFEARFETKAR
jgi:hypothetical protein